MHLHKALHNLKKKGIDHVILEASSHGLKQKRLDNLNISTGIFTNLSHDHLDYHKNFNSYLKAKMLTIQPVSNVQTFFFFKSYFLLSFNKSY